MKFTFKRVLSFAIALVMILGLLPTIQQHAHAASTLTVPDANIGLSWTTTASGSKGKASWTAIGNNLTGTTTGYVSVIFPKTVTATLTITNNHSEDRTLVFDYTLTGGGSVSGIISGTSGSYSETLAAGASTSITLTSPSGTSTNTLTLSGLQLLAAGNVTSTFLAPENGSYTVDGTAINAQTTMEKSSTEAYALKATPASGYMFFGWYSEASGSYVSYDAETSQIFGSDPQLKPVFIPSTTALFGVGSAKFADLTEACNFANSASASTKTVVLLNNGTVSGSHIIPAGITLLIPFDSANTLYTSEPACTSSIGSNAAWVQPTAYRTLTLASDANITVNGAISISGKHAASNGGKPYSGAPTGPVGWVQMMSGSQITLNSGANLYVWGFIQGAGNITAKNGSHVYENFQFTDFRGGSNLTQMIGEGTVFPINQYYVQNIEVATKYEAGAKETLYTSAYASGMVLGGSAPFIGEGGMFVINSGYVIKDYIENRDRMQVDVHGDIDMSSMTVDVGQQVDSSTYILPITNNITINIKSGTTTVKQSIALLPGVEMTIDSGAILDIAYSDVAINDYNTQGYNLVVYDRDEWFYGFNMETGEVVEGVQYAFGSSVIGMYPLPYAPGRTYNRTAANDLNDAFIDVNGTIISNGFIYTTTGGAAIKSTGKTGKIVMQSGSGFDMFTFQANAGTSLGIMMNSAALMNGDGTYLNTITFDEDFNPITYAEAGTTYDYCAIHDCWYTGECEKCAIPESVEITWIVNGESSKNEVDYNSVPVYPGSTPTKAADASGHYTFAGWATTENGTVLSALPAVTGEATYYAVFTSAAHNDDKIEDGKHYCSACNYLIGSCNDTNKDHKCDVGGEDMACHQGTLTQQAGQSATCGADGWKAYYQCSCGKYYVDNQAQTLIPDLEAWKTGDGKISATGNHTPETDDGDCTTAIECSVCGTVTTPAKTHVDGDDKNHVCDNAGCTVDNVDGGHTPAADDGDCTTAILCTECGAETTAAKSHVDGDDKNHVCDNEGCNVDNVDGGHTPAADDGDCTTAILCTECGAETTAAKSHVDGDDKDHDCDNCDVKNIEGHTNGTPVQENIEDAKCETAGSYDEVVYCTECGEEVSRTNKEIPALQHDWNDPTYTWSNDGKECTAERTCKRDGSHKETETVTATGVVTTDPTCTVMGVTTYTANFTAGWAKQQTTTRDDVPATDHAWTVSYEWSTDGKSCTATRTCGNDAEHNLTETVIADGVVTTDPTCTEKGTTTYTANFVANWAVDGQTTTRQDVDAKDHDWTVSYEWSADGKSCTATRACGNDAKHNLTETVTATGVVTTDPTCTAMGVTTYTANFDAEWAVDGQTTTRTDVAKEEHTFNSKASGQLATAADCENAATYYVQCDNCDAVSTDKTVAVGEANGHAFNNKASDQQATAADCENAATYYVQCDNCDAVSTNKTVAVGSALGHYWQFNGYTNDDDKTHTINYVCSHNASHTKSESSEHDYTTGNSAYTCICGDVKQFTVYWYDWNSVLLGTSLVDYGAPLPTCPYSPTIPEGYYGVGWHDMYSGEEAPETMPANDLYLKYFISPIKYTVAFLYENGETWEVHDSYHGDVIKNLAEYHPYPETKVGHTFIGWGVKDDATGEIELVTEMTVTGELTLYPVFEVNKYTLTVYDMPAAAYNADPKEFTVTYGTNILDFINGKVDLNNVDVNNDLYKGYYFWQGRWMDYTNWITIDEDSIVSDNIEIFAASLYHGWQRMSTDDPWSYSDMGAFVTGWHEVDGEWYYFFMNEATYWNYPATGLTRVPYPTEEINGIKYLPDAETLEYCANKGTTFIDETYAWFGFDADGKFQSGFTGLTAHPVIENVLCYAENGMLVWHPGFVEVDGELYYFIGDVDNGGNIPANGDTYITRPNGVDGFAKNDVYNFADGKLSGVNGIVNMKYYENSKLMMGKGLVALEVDGEIKYIYVRTSGQLATGKYWISNNNGLPVKLKGYDFDENGYMMVPVDPSVNGFVMVDGTKYYYKDGEPYGAGLIEVEGNFYYVRWTGEVVVNCEYWVTTTNGHMDQGKYAFDENGVMQLNTGVINGYYYVDGQIAYGAGLIEWNGDIYYVRSNGQVATGEYWPTTLNGILPAGKYTFDEDGKLITD